MKLSNSPHLLVGLTGTIGSGKSAAGSILERCGAHIVDADVLAREVVSSGSTGLEQILTTFGPEYLKANFELDRRKLAQLIFSDAEAEH